MKPRSGQEVEDIAKDCSLRAQNRIIFMSEIKYMPEYKTRINGVPVIFQNAPYSEAWGSREIQINFHSKDLENEVCRFLLQKRPIITGGILKFIRSYLEYSLQQMNDAFFNKTKTTLAEWEKHLDKPIPAENKLMNKIYDKLFTVYQAHIMESLLENREVGNDPLSESMPIQFNTSRFNEFDEVGS